MADLTPLERCALLIELGECERRGDQLKIRVGELEPPIGEERAAERIEIPEEKKPRAEARIDALEQRAQEILEELWPIGDRGGPAPSVGV